MSDTRPGYGCLRIAFVVRRLQTDARKALHDGRNAMKFLDSSTLQAIDAAAYRHQRPFPWIDPAGLLRDEAFAALVADLPDISQFKKAFGHQRRFGQTSHDCYSLKYRPGLEIPEPWQAFIDEWHGPEYRAFLSRMLGHRAMRLDFLWFYTPSGCSVSPHCDQKDRLGAQIFYLNTDRDWKRDRGGETLILGASRRIPYRSAPGFEDFEMVVASDGMNNRSLLFSRSNRSWRGVRMIDCPDGHQRRIFLVTVKRVSAAERLARHVGGLFPERSSLAESTPA